MNFNSKQMEILMIVKELGLKLAIDGELDFDEILMKLYRYREYCDNTDYGETIMNLNNKANDGDLSNPDEILLPILKVIKTIVYDDYDDDFYFRDELIL